MPSSIHARRTVMIAAALCSLALRQAPAFSFADPSPLDSVRAYWTQSAFFEYALTGVAAPATRQPIFSFTHLSGARLSAGLGDRVGEYEICLFELLTESVFNDSINAIMERNRARVTLAGPGGERVVLDEGTPLPRPGWIACLVHLDSGSWRVVKDGDRLTFEGRPLYVEAVFEDHLDLRVDGRIVSVPLVSKGEKERLESLWAKGERERENQEYLAEENRKKRLEQEELRRQFSQTPSRESPRGRISVEWRQPPRCVFGEGYAWPSEYTVLPAVWTASGKMLRPTIVVPTRFQWRQAGVSITYK